MNLPANTFATVRDLLRYAVSRFQAAGLYFGHGSNNAYDEAVYLILFTLNLPIDRLEPFLDARLLSDEISSVLDVIERRTTDRIPAAYLTREAWLGEYRFYVDERVLIPRSFIAELIPDKFAPWISNPDSIENVLELCTGSGCLAIMLADAFPNAEIDATDLSSDALDVADDERIHGGIFGKNTGPRQQNQHRYPENVQRRKKRRREAGLFFPGGHHKFGVTPSGGFVPPSGGATV